MWQLYLPWLSEALSPQDMAEEDGLRKQQKTFVKPSGIFCWSFRWEQGVFHISWRTSRSEDIVPRKKQPLKTKHLTRSISASKWKPSCSFCLAIRYIVIHCVQTRKWLTQMGKNQRFQDLTTDLTKWCYIRAMSNFLEPPKTLWEDSCNLSTNKSNKELQAARSWTLKECIRQISTFKPWIRSIFLLSNITRLGGLYTSLYFYISW